MALSRPLALPSTSCSLHTSHCFGKPVHVEGDSGSKALLAGCVATATALGARNRRLRTLPAISFGMPSPSSSSRSCRQRSRRRAASISSPQDDDSWRHVREKLVTAVDSRGLGKVYDPVRLEAYFSQRPFEVLSRIVGFAGTAIRSASAAFVEQTFQKSDEGDRRLAARLRELLTELGPTFVKLGQALSVRPDVLPEAFIQEFQPFQDHVAPFSDEEAFRLLQQELGIKSFSEVFASLGSKPVAAASLGQVYKARLLDGTAVAVKVQRPRLDDIVGLDLVLARQLAKALLSFQSWLPKGLQGNDFVSFVDAFGQRVFEELDYENEVKNAQRFLQLYGDQARLKVPVVYPKLTTRRVIVMEWIDGVKLTDEEGIRKQGLDPLDFISIGIECSMRQLLEHGFFHADPHPGNFFVTPKGELCVLDFGMMSEMPKGARLSLIQHIVHLVNRDYMGMARDYYHLGFLSPDIDVRPIAPKLEAFFEPRLQAATVSAINFKTIVDGLGDVIFKNYPFTVPAFYALVVRSLVNLEGLALSIDPNYRVLAAAYPYVARRILLDAELRSSLIELLFSSAASSSKAAQFRWDRAANLLRESAKSTVAMPSGQSESNGVETGGKDDTALLLDLGSSLIEDPAFRQTLLSELASTADVLITDMIVGAIGRLVQGEDFDSQGNVRRTVGLRGEDQERVIEVRQTVNLLAEKMADRIPTAPEVVQAAFTAATSAASDVFQSAVSTAQSFFGASSVKPAEKPQDQRTSSPSLPDVAGEFVGQLGERAAVRTLRTIARLIEPKPEELTEKPQNSTASRIESTQKSSGTTKIATSLRS